jgi:hypothetical protein
MNKWVLMGISTTNAWKVLSLVLQGCTYICLALWIYTTSTVCSSPGALDMITGHVIAYNCHGSIVFLTRTQDVLLKGLVPALILLGGSAVATRQRAKRAPVGD